MIITHHPILRFLPSRHSRHLLAILTPWRMVSLPTFTLPTRSEAQRLGWIPRHQHHYFHWYPAKLFYRIPLHIFEILAPPEGTVVLDPFCGSGTVLVEALAKRFRPIGLDINPIAQLISRAKTTPLPEPDLRRILSSIVDRARTMRRIPPPAQLPSFWFTDAARKALYRLYHAVLEVVTSTPYRTFFFATLSSITRRCSLADPFVPPPVRMRHHRALRAGSRYQHALTSALHLTEKAIYARFNDVALRNISRLCTFLSPNDTPATVLSRSALDMQLPDKHIDLIITSPPYCGAQKYVRTFRLELLLLGHTPDEIALLDRSTLGTERPGPELIVHPRELPNAQQMLIGAVAQRNPRRAKMLELYLKGLFEFAFETKRVLKSDGNAFLTFGVSHFSGIPVDLAHCFSELAECAGLTVFRRFTDTIPSRGLITKRNHTASVIATEHVLWIRP